MGTVAQSQSQSPKPSFTCKICGKGFDQKRPQIRHLSYCKKSINRVPKSRKKACVQCTKAKTQCEVQSTTNNSHIQCSRCRTKGIDCRFDRPRFVDSVDEVSPSTTVEIATDSLPKTKETHVESSDSIFELVEIPNYELALLDSRDDSSNSSGSAVELFQTSTSTTASTDLWTKIITASGYEEFSSDAFSFPPSTNGPFLSDEGRYSLYPKYDTSIFNQISPKPPKSFWSSRERDQNKELTRRYIVCVIKSYPNMLLEHKLPPFIHHSCLSGEPNLNFGTSLPSPLSVCAVIVQMFNSKNKSNTTFLWRTVRMEQERIDAEYLLFDEFEAVAALQAITIYTLLRLSEEDEDATDFDIPLIQTMIKLTIYTNQITTRHTLPSKNGKKTWKDWGLIESLIRTFTLLCLIDLLFDLSAGQTSHQCDGSQFAKLTLPCSKKIWNAASEVEWQRSANNQMNGLDESSNSLTYGDILRFQLGVDTCGERLDRWMGSIDEFGALIMAAANLTGKNYRAFS